MIGSIVSHYQIEEEIGRGGMGVVYRARDVRLDRTVALKFLSVAVTHDPEALERFQREAKTAAKTEHPNVCGVYDIGTTDDGKRYIAMPFYDGSSLGDRIESGPLDAAEAVSLARQIASGLSSVHVHGIVHRDIKPGNIIVTDDGLAKILDFGISKMAGSQTLTADGSTLGTFAYMSPEQIRGEKLDARSDIWSLGAVLYEMLAGRRPFPGEYAEAMMYAVLNEEPASLSTSRADLPDGLESIVARCLDKDRATRYQTMAELEHDLTAIESGSAPEVTAKRQPVEAKGAIPVRAVVAVAVVVAVVIAASLLLKRGTETPVSSPMRFTMLLPDGQRLATTGPSLAISRDGSRLAFAAGDSSGTRIYVRDIDSFDAEPIAGTDDARAPFFSPDGEWLGFLADEKLFKVPIEGGRPLELADAPTIAAFMRGSAVWLDDDRIVFSTFGRDGGLFAVHSEGGAVERLTTAEGAGTHHHLWPEAVPSTPYVLYSDVVSAKVPAIAVLSLEDSTSRTIVPQGNRPMFIPPDVLVYALGSDLFAVRFDTRRGEAIGDPVPVLNGVVSAEQHFVEYDVSDQGAIVYASQGSAQFEAKLTLASFSGVLNPLPVPMTNAFTPRSSPDGRFVAFQRRSPNAWSLWLHDLERGVTSQLTDDESQDYWMTWTPDSERLIFNSDRESGPDGTVDMFEIKPESLVEPALIWDGESQGIPHAVTPDGQTLIYNGMGENMQLDILARPLDGSAAVLPLVTSNEDDFHPAISPNGKWLAFASSRSGDWEVYIQPFPGPGGVVQVSADGGAEPVWAPDGETLYYRHPAGHKIFGVDVSDPAIETGEPTLRLGSPHLVLSGAFFTCSKWGRSYDVTPDGDEFVVVSTDWPGAERRRFNVVVNWSTEVQRLLNRAG